MSFCNENEGNNCLKNCHFIMLQLKNHALNALVADIIYEFPFYNKLRIVKPSKAYARYVRSFNIEIIDPNKNQFN